MAAVLASTEMLGTRSTGEKVTITVRIGQPYADGPDCWRCPVSVEPLYSKLADIAGADSLQAVVLACNLAFTLLQDFKDKGGKLTYEDGGEFPLEAYRCGKPKPAADA